MGSRRSHTSSGVATCTSTKRRSQQRAQHGRKLTQSAPKAVNLMQKSNQRPRGAWPDLDSVSGGQGAAWEVSDFLHTRTLCRLRVRLHGIEITTSRSAPRVVGFGAGFGRGSETLRGIASDRTRSPLPCPELLAGHGRATMLRRSIRRAESEPPRPSRRGSSDAATGDKQTSLPFGATLRASPAGAGGGLRPL